MCHNLAYPTENEAYSEQMLLNNEHHGYYQTASMVYPDYYMYNYNNNNCMLPTYLG